jgi:hypothetical protein
VPGASLYSFERRVPVAISFRWFTQCVVLAYANEGGVSARFLAHMIEGEHGETNTVQSDNYKKGLKYMKHISSRLISFLCWCLQPRTFTVTAVPITKLSRNRCTLGVCSLCVCVFYYCRTYYKAVRVGGGGEWRTGAMRDDEPRPVWMSLLITH